MKSLFRKLVPLTLNILLFSTLTVTHLSCISSTANVGDIASNGSTGGISGGDGTGIDGQSNTPNQAAPTLPPIVAGPEADAVIGLIATAKLTMCSQSVVLENENQINKEESAEQETSEPKITSHISGQLGKPGLGGFIECSDTSCDNQIIQVIDWHSGSHGQYIQVETQKLNNIHGKFEVNWSSKVNPKFGFYIYRSTHSIPSPSNKVQDCTPQDCFSMGWGINNWSYVHIIYEGSCSSFK